MRIKNGLGVFSIHNKPSELLCKIAVCRSETEMTKKWHKN